MIASWMLAATLLGVIAVLAATALERALRLLGRQGRSAWILALAVTAAWPLLAPLVIRPTEVRNEARVVSNGPVPVVVDQAPVASPVASRLESIRALLATLDRPLSTLWLVATALLLLRAAFAMGALRRLARAAEPREIDGQSVLISPGVGPAAFGIVNPRIVLPRWSLDLDASMREMVLLHEREHLAAADPAMLTAAWIAAALMPWNVALWWIAQRLRTATELDCDHRVVRRGTDARRYAQLLLLIAQRQGAASFASLIAGSPSTLRERITAMHAAQPSRPLLRAALLVLAAVAISLVAVSPALATELASVGERFHPASVAANKPSEAALHEPASRQTQDSTRRAAERRAAEQRAVEQRAVEQRAAAERESERRAVERRAVEERKLERLPADRSEVELRKLEQEVVVQRAPERLAVDSSLRERRQLLERAKVDDSTRERAELETALRRDASEQERVDSTRKVRVDSVLKRVREDARKPAPDDSVVRTVVREVRADSMARFAPGGSPTPRYPDMLRKAGIDGTVLVQVVVDSSGLPVPGSARVLQRSHDLFEASVRHVLPDLRFIPPTVGARHVRQLVQLVYRFQVEGSPNVAAPARSPGVLRSDVLTFEILVTEPPR